MNELISQVTSQLGLSTPNAETAVGSVLGFLKEKAGGGAAQAIDALPGAGPLLSKANTVPAPAAGGLGDLLGAAGGLLGQGGGALGQLGELAPLVARLSGSGLNAESSMQLVPLVLKFIQPHLGSEKMAGLLGALPALGGLLGGGAQAPAPGGLDLGGIAKGLGKLNF